MNNHILDILSKLNSGDISQVSQKELLLALFYEQKSTNEKLEEMGQDINHLKEKNADQDNISLGLKEDIANLQKRLDEELAKKQARFQVLGWFAAILSVLATIVSIWSRVTAKLGLIIYKTGLWGF